MLKIVQARLQQYVNQELLDVQLDLEKAEEPEIKLMTSFDHRENKWVPEKISTCALLTHQILWLCGSQQTVENS